MTGNDAIPITLPADQWREVWKLPFHPTAKQEIESKGKDADGQPFECVLQRAELVCIGLDLSGTEIGDELRRQVAPWFTEDHFWR